MVPPEPSPIGTRYRVDELLGGTASRVHRAHDLLLQRDVAIKSFPGADGPRRWRRDARLRRRLGTGQAMEVLDGAPDGDDEPFVVMPLARDGSLDRTAAAWEPWPAAVLVARLAVGLRRLHGLGAVHGAVTADAVLLDPQHGPRWTGHGGVPAPGATAEDDVIAFARIAAAVVADLPGDGDVSAELVDVVRDVVRGPVDVAGLERLRAALAAEVGRLGTRPSIVAPAAPAAVRTRRSRSTLVAACAAAVVAGGVFGVGAGIVGDGGPTAVAADVTGGVPAPAAPAIGGGGARAAVVPAPRTTGRVPPGPDADRAAPSTPRRDATAARRAATGGAARAADGAASAAPTRTAGRHDRPARTPAAVAADDGGRRGGGSQRSGEGARPVRDRTADEGRVGGPGRGGDDRADRADRADGDRDGGSDRDDGSGPDSRDGRSDEAV